jgi:hypothetical protein
VTERYDDHRIDEMLRGLAAETRPATAEELVEARRPLAQAILNEQRRARSRRRRHPAWTIAVAAAVILAAVSAVQLRKPSRLEAALDQYAEVVSLTEPLTPISGQYIFQESRYENLGVFSGDIEIPYLWTEERSVWIGADHTIAKQWTTTGLRFFTPDAQQAFDALGPDAYPQVGETRVYTQQVDSPDDYPTNPDELEQYLREQLRLGGQTLPENVRLFSDLASLLSDPLASSQLRAAAVQVIVSVRGVKLLEQSDSGIAVALVFEDPTLESRIRETITLDLSLAQLTRHTEELIDGNEGLGIPAGTLIVNEQFGPITLTTEGPPPNNP